METKLGEFDALLVDLKTRRAALVEAIEQLRRHIRKPYAVRKQAR